MKNLRQGIWRILLLCAVSAVLILSSLSTVNFAQASASSALFKIVGHLSLPQGYTVTIPANPTYIPNVNTIYLFATKNNTTYFLALSGTTGKIIAKIAFSASTNFIYDPTDSRLFVGQAGTWIIGISAKTNKVVANITAPDRVYSLAYDNYNNKVYAITSDTYVDTFSAATGAFKGRILVMTPGTGSTNSIVYDFKNYDVYVDYFVTNSMFPIGIERVAVIPSNSLTVSKNMNAPDVNVTSSEYPFSSQGGYLIFDGTTNVLIDTQPSTICTSEPFGGYDAFNTTTNTIISSMSSTASTAGQDASHYDAGRQSDWGNYVIATSNPSGCGEGATPSSFENSLNSSVPGQAIPSINPNKFWYEGCYGEVLSSPNFKANFAQCQSYNPNTLEPAGPPHLDILSTINGSLLARITYPSVAVNGQKTYYTLLPFGDNAVRNIEYALGEGTGTIYEISA